MVSERLRSLRTVFAASASAAFLSLTPALAETDLLICAKESGDKAIEACSRVIAQNPNDAGAYSNRGFTLSAKGEIDRAILDFSEAIKLNPKHAKAYNNRGVAWNRK